VSDRPNSAFQWLRDSSLQIISALIGSSLLVTIITTGYSEINQPHVYLNVIPHYPTPVNPSEIAEPSIKYYEIIAKNDGRRQATNMNLSMYFFGTVSNYTTFFTGETINEPEDQKQEGAKTIPIETIDDRNEMAQQTVSLLRWDIPRLAPGAMIIFDVWTDADKFDPYYITATFDEGSATYPVFGFHDIESGLFPNILAGREDAQTIQRLMIIFVVLCAISFTIAIAHKKIKDIIKKRREGRRWNEIEFDLFLAIPITILSSILILYICEEIPRSILLESLIMPPLDATDGASINQEVTYNGIAYKQGYLLLIAGIFWGISFFARSLMSYFIAKVIIKKLYNKELPKQFLASTSVFLMGEPVASSIILFFSKSTYSISPVYLFSMFLVLDIIRMSVLVLLIPKLSMKNNSLLYYGLVAICLVAGLLQLLVFSTLLKIDSTNEIEASFESSFLSLLVFICLIAGLLQLTQIVLVRHKEKVNATARWPHLAAATISAGLIIAWIAILYDTTSRQDALIFTGSSIILTGIIVIVLNISFIGITRVMDIRKIYRVSLTLEIAHNSSDASPERSFPVHAPLKVKGELKYNDSRRKLGKPRITVDNGEDRIEDRRRFQFNQNGTYECEVSAPSHPGEFKMQAHLEGFSRWRPKRITKYRFLNNIFFIIEVTPSAYSKEVPYQARLRNVSLCIETGTMNKDACFIPKSEFKPGELITFVVTFLDADDQNTPKSGMTDITLMLYGPNAHRVTNPLPATDDKGKTYASIIAPSIVTEGWMFQAYYTGNSVYAKANSPLASYSTLIPVPSSS
jgi:hypothetical protein